MNMSPTVIATAWIAIGGFLALFELLSATFGFILVGMACIVGALLAAFNFSLGIQAGGFFLTTFFLLWIIRPTILKKLHTSVGVPARMASLIGKTGLVTEEINPEISAGRILVLDEDWAARASENIPKGTTVMVTGADGIVLLVRPLNQGEKS